MKVLSEDYSGTQSVVVMESRAGHQRQCPHWCTPEIPSTGSAVVGNATVATWVAAVPSMRCQTVPCRNCTRKTDG